MKKLFLFVLFSAVAIGFTACSKDDNGGSTSDLVGKWEFDKMRVEYGGEGMTTPYYHECPSKKDYVEFMANGVMKNVDYDEDCESYEEQGRWERSGDTLTLRDEDNDVAVYEILELNSSKLKIKGSEDGYTITLELKRV